MAGLLIQLAVSWLLLWFIDKKHLTVLGFKPTNQRVQQFTFGFTLSALVFTLYCLTITFFTHNHWSINQAFSRYDFIKSTWWTINSVLFEELIFRGALLYLLIHKTSERIGCFTSAVAFGIYHWFSFGVLGNPVQMIYVFIMTGVWGIMFAFAFSRTNALYLPVGLHLGWNLFNTVVFSQGPLGSQLFVSSHNGQLLTGFASIAIQLFQLLAVPVIVYFYLRKYKMVAVKVRKIYPTDL
jgi:hypothetical protein